MILQLWAGGAVLLIFAISVLRNLRQGRLSFDYAALWILIFLSLLAGLIFFSQQQALGNLLGVSPSGAAVGGAIFLTLTITFRHSLTVSKIHHDFLASAQQSAVSQFWMQNTDFVARGERSILVLIPAYNEQDTIKRVLDEVREAGFDCLVINDGSADQTSLIAREAGARVVDLPFNFGIGAALQVGFSIAHSAGYLYVVQCDADGQHDPHQISKLVRTAEKFDADLVIGSRFAEGKRIEQYEPSTIRRWVMNFLSSRATKVSGTRITDSTSGFRCIRQPLLGAFAERYPAEYMESFESLVRAATAGWTIHEVGVTMRARLGGQPSHGPIRSALYLFRVVVVIVLGASKVRRFKNKN